jgi:hypothetical protein
MSKTILLAAATAPVLIVPMTVARVPALATTVAAAATS